MRFNGAPSQDWITRKHPKTGENQLDRMPVILPPEAYDRWLANIEPDPRDLLVPFPSELMKTWPISTRVNKPANDDAAILEPVKTEDAPRSFGSVGHRIF